ncbi:MAG: EAL domain-containing protein [Geminicoccaceae bacterium]
MSLRSRIAATIFLLEFILIAAVLYITLTHSMESVDRQINSSQKVTLNLLGDLSKAALITEEFNELQSFIRNMTRDPNIKTVIIGDIDGEVIAATDPDMVGDRLPTLPDVDHHYWQRIGIHGASARLGSLAIEFSQVPLRSAFQKTLNLGMAVAIAGIVITALVAWSIGHVLTRRLWRLAIAADKIACGESEARVFLPGSDEVARVGRAFNSMVDRLRQNLSAVQTSRDRLIKPTEAISEGFALWSADDRLVLCNRPFRDIFETIEPSLEIGMAYADFARLIDKNLVGPAPAQSADDAGLDPLDSAREHDEDGVNTREVLLGAGQWVSLCEFRTPDRERVGIYSDITAQKATEETIRYQATHDALTGLPNRSLFGERLADALSTARDTGERLAVAFLDLDRFKLVNDGLGHRIGDELLLAISERLHRSVGERDMVARMGGDEFILFLRDIGNMGSSHVDTGNAATVGARAEHILESMHPPFNIGGHELHITASIGVSLFPEDGRTADLLLKAADVALYNAKAAGRDRWQLVHSAADGGALERIVLESQLRRAVELEQFTLLYQPQINLSSGQLVGVEALIRWRHPEEGIVAPERFITLAEETGLIHSLGLWILQTTCAQHRAWRQAGLEEIRLAVNISPYQLRRPSFLHDIETILRDTEMPLDLLELELTETALMQEGETTKLLDQLTGMGLSIALDDFGTGYSSLSYLRRFPIDRIKIDRSFVCDISGSQSDGALARAVIMLAHGLNIGVVAEGVETAAQLSLLRHFGCDEAQGYLLGEPVAGDQICNLGVERSWQPSNLALAMG